MNTKTTLALLIVAAAVGAAIFFAPRKASDSIDTPKPATPTGKGLFDPAVSVDAVTKIELEQPGKPKLVFEREAREPNAPATTQVEYRMLEPVAAPSESWAVRGLVSTIAGLQTREQFEPGKNGQPGLAEMGLEPPVAIVRLTDEAGQMHAVEIGRKVVMSDDTYARKVGETVVHVIKTDLTEQVRKGVADFRSKKLLDFVTDQAVNLRIGFEGRSFDLARVGNFDWTFGAPLGGFADRDKVRQLITKLLQLRADEFVSDEPASLGMYGLDDPYLSFELTTEYVPPPSSEEPQARIPQAAATKTMRLLFGNTAGVGGDKRYVKLGDAPWVASVAEATVKGLVPNLKELRDPRVTRVKAGDIRKLQIASGGETAVIERSDEGWKGVSGVSEVDQTAVGDLLAALEAIRAIDFVDDHAGSVLSPDAPFGLAKPRSTITITATGLIKPLVLRVGAATATGRNAYLHRDEEAGVIVAAEAQAEKLAAGVLALRSRDILSVQPDSIRTLELVRDGFVLRVERDGETWKLTQPSDAPLNLVATGALATNVARLRAKRIVDAEDARSISFEKPAAVIRASVDGAGSAAGPEPSPPPASTYELRLVRKDGAGYVRVGSAPIVYELDDAVYGVLVAELLESRIFDFDTSSVASLEIRSSRGTLALKRTPNGWRYAPDPYVALDDVKVGQLVDAVVKLRVESYLAWRGGALESRGLGDDSPASLRIALANQGEVVARFAPEGDAACARLGGIADSGRIFRISATDCDAISRTLDDLLKSDKPTAPPAPRMPAPAAP